MNTRREELKVLTKHVAHKKWDTMVDKAIRSFLSYDRDMVQWLK